MKPMLTLTDFSQIKALSDPFRAEIMHRELQKYFAGSKFLVFSPEIIAIS